MGLSLQFDIVVELVSFVTAVLLTGFSLYAYHRTRTTRHLAFGAAFALLALASASNAVFNYLVQLELLRIPFRGYLAISAFDDFFRLMFYMLSIGGYTLIFLIAERIASPRVAMLMLLLAPLTAWVSHEFYFVYHVVAILLLLCALIHFYRSFLDSGSRNARNVAFGFGLLLTSEVVFVFSIFSVWLYHLGHLLRLFGFALLLITIACIYYMAERVSRQTSTASPARSASRSAHYGGARKGTRAR